MSRLISYPYDNIVTDGDAWVGSEVSSRQTKQYTAAAVADYLNINGKISIIGQMTYQYGPTPLSGVGTLAIFGGGPETVAFSAVTKLTLSNQDIGGQRVVEFLNLLVGSDVLIAEQGAISTFGYYSIDSYATNATDPDYYDLGVTFKSGNGSMRSDRIYEAQNFVLANDATQSPWNTVPDGISYTAANVGVGTVTPGEKLEVSGNILSDNVLIKNTEGYKAQLNSSELSEDRGFGFPDSSGTLALTSDITSSPWDTVTGGINYANGNVGIGTTSPSEKLHIKDETPTIRLEDTSSSNYAELYVNNFDTYLNSNGRIFLQNGGSTRATVTPAGNVGIGTTSPSQKLEVDGDVKINRTDNTAGRLTIDTNRSFGRDFTITNNGQEPHIDATDILKITADGGSAGIRIDASGPDYINLTTENSERMRIDSSGNVGIGTTSPSGLLHVSSGTSGDAVVIIESDTDNNNENDNPQLQFKQDGGATIAKIGLTGDGAGTDYTGSLINAAYFGNDELAALQLYTDATARLTIEPNGDVGIGTTSPSEKLDVAGSINTSGSIKGPSLFEIFSQYTNRGRITLNSSTNAGANQISLLTDGNVRMVVNKEGNVGIGTTSPGEKLEVSGGNIKGDGLIQVENSSDNNIIGKLIINYGSGNNPRLNSVGGTEIDFQTDLVIRNNKGLYSDTSSSTGLIIGSQRANTPIKFLTSPATHSTYSEAMRIAGDGNVGIGTTSPSEKLHVVGNSKIEGSFAIHNTKIQDVNGQVYFDNLTNGGDIFLRTRDDQGGSDIGIIINGTDKTVSLHYNTIAKLITASDGIIVNGEVLSDGYRLSAMQTAPAARDSAGTLGEIRITSTYIYVCYATDSWSRVALDTSW